MGYYTKAILGVSLFLMGVTGFCWGLHGLVGLSTDPLGPDSPALRLPGSVGGMAALLVGAVFLGLAGLALAALRGDPPGVRPGGRPNWLEALGIGLSSWGIFFTAAGGTALLTALGPGSANVAGARLGMGITGVVFVLMGLAPLMLAIRWALMDRHTAATVGHAEEEAAASLPLGASMASLYQTANLLGSRRTSAVESEALDPDAATADGGLPMPPEVPPAPDAPAPP